MREGELLAGRYRLGPVLGRGAMGQVFRARDERLQREVAVKMVDLAGTDPGTAERFHRETIATARLNHPGIVTIFDADTTGQAAYLVMELLPGRPLSRVIREQGPLPVPDAVRVAGQVARALEATHHIGVVHRDVKPANIMLDGGRAKLLDFGIALVSLDAEAQLTAPATTLGTAAYMSPEQARGDRATAASDVYGLGCVLVAMLTGNPPYAGDSAIAVLHRHLSEPVPSVRARRPDVPATVDDLVRRMLAKDPAARPATSDVVTALGHLARNLPDADGTRPLPSAAPAGRTTRPAAAVPPPTTVQPAATVVQPAATAVQHSTTAVQPPATAVLRSAPRSPAPPPDAAPRRRSWAGRAGRWLGLLIVALLVFAVVWAFGSSLVRELAGAVRAPQVTLPSIDLPSLPSAGDVGREAAARAVDAALDAIDASRSEETAQAKERLTERWDRVADALADGRPVDDALEDFRDEVAEARESGALGVAEAAAIRLALRVVEAAV